jgi:hypothetical protein
MTGEATGAGRGRSYPRTVHRPVAARRRGWSRCGARAVTALLALALVPGCAPTGDGTGEASPTVIATPLPDPAADITNGVDARPADAVLAQALATLLAAGTYRVSGSPAEGEPLDLRYTSGSTLGRPGVGPAGGDPTAAVGRGATGTLTIDGSAFEVLAIDGAVYVRGDLTWLATTVAPEALTTLGQKWLLLPPAAAAELATVFDPELFATELLDPRGPVTSVGAAQVDGQPAWGLRAVESGAITWVTGTGPVLPLQVEREGATATTGTLIISDVGTEVPLAPPPADQVVVVSAGSAPAG